MTSGRRLLLRAAAASLVATAALAIAILLFGGFGETELRVLGTTAFISLFSLLSLPAGVLLDQGRARPLAWATAALAAVGFVLAVAALWGDDDGDNETLWKLVLAVVVASIAATQTAALVSRLRHDDPSSVRRLFVASVVSVALAAALANVAIWTEPDSEGFYRFLAALAVANVLLVVLQPVLRRGRAQDEPYRLRLTLEDGSTSDVEVRAGALADAAAKAIRAAERDGKRLRALERVRS